MDEIIVDDIDEEMDEEKVIKTDMSVHVFKEIPIRRGFTEIAEVYEDVTRLNGFICGGYARYCASPKKVPFPASDCDIYCKTPEAYHSIVEIFGKTHKGKYKFKVRHENDISVTFSNHNTGKYMYLPTIQIIKPVKKGAIASYGTIEEVLGNFDFTVARVAIKDEKTAVCDQDFERDEKANLLSMRVVHCPASALLRSLKYAKKGYYMRPSESIKLFEDWEKRNAEYKKRILELFNSSNFGNITREEVDELERLLRVD
jgi:hypothetical protein